MTSHDATPGTRAGTHRAGPVKNTGHAAGPGPVSAAARALWRERAPGPASTPHRHPHRHRGAQRSPRCEVLAVREFGGLWHAQVLSAAGDQLAQIAVAVVAYEQTRSAFLTALVYAMSCLPQVIGGPLLAEVAGLLPRRTVMIGLNLSRAAIAAIMALSRMPFAALCALLVIAVMLGASFSATRAATLPEVLPAGQLMAGTEISSIGSRAGQALGFLAGGAAVAVLRPGGLLMVAAVTFLAVAGIISWLASRCPAGQPGPHGRPLALPVTRAEAAAVMRQPLPRVLLLLGWLAGCAVVPEALAMPYAHVLHGGLATAGLLMAAIPAGAVAGAAAITFLPRPSSRLRILAWLAAASCAPLAAISLHPPLGAVLVLWLLAGAAGAYQLVAAGALVRALPAGDRACAVDLAQSGLLAAQGTGLLAAGGAAQLVGPQAAIAVTGLAGLVAAAVLAGTWRRVLGRTGRPAPW